MQFSPCRISAQIAGPQSEPIRLTEPYNYFMNEFLWWLLVCMHESGHICVHRYAHWDYMSLSLPAGLPVPSCDFLVSLGSGPQELHSCSSGHPIHGLCFGSGIDR